MNRKIFKMGILVISFLIIVGGCMGIVSASVNPPVFCEFWGYITLDGEPAPLGTVITVSDPDGVLIGLLTVDNIEGVYGYLRAVGDESTPGDQGAEDGDVMTFYVNGYLAEVVSGDNTWTQWGQKQVDIRAISGENVPEFSLIMVPFMLSLMIYGMSRRRIGL